MNEYFWMNTFIRNNKWRKEEKYTRTTQEMIQITQKRGKNHTTVFILIFV